MEEVRVAVKIVQNNKLSNPFANTILSFLDRDRIEEGGKQGKEILRGSLSHRRVRSGSGRLLLFDLTKK